MIPLLGFSFAIFSQQDTLVPESIKAPVEFPNPEDLDKLLLSVINETEEKLVQETYSMNLFAIRLSQQAINKTKSTDLKDFAALINKEHSDMNEDLHTLAGIKRIVLADTLPIAQMELLNQLLANNDKKYNLEVVSLMVKKHQEAIGVSERAVKVCTDKDFREWFESSLPTLHKHLKTARSLKEKLNSAEN